MKRALVCLFLVSAPAYLFAQAVAPVPSLPAAEVASPKAVPAFSSQKWLAAKGVVSSDELVDVLGAKLSPEQRKQLDETVARRNAKVQKANDEMAASLRDLLQESDEGLSKLVDESAEAKRMERMKRLQPMRYQQLMGQKKAKEKNAKEKQTPK